MSQAPNTIFAPPDAQFGSPQPQRQGSNVLGIVGFILSTLGLIVCCVPFVGFIGTIGLILCFIALFRPPRGFAIAGTIIGIIATIFAVLWLVAFLALGNAFRASGGFFDFFKAAMVTAQAEEQRNRSGAYPPDLASIKELPPDWRKDTNGVEFGYVVAQDGSTFSLKGAGPDKVLGTPDDIDFIEIFRQHNVQLGRTQSWPPPAPMPPADPNAPTDPAAPSPPASDKGPV
jgi:hypothetical protein